MTLFNHKIFWLCIGASSSYDHPAALAAKNREADLTNPNLVANNIYHSIEDLNRPDNEHLYDEINQQKANNLLGTVTIQFNIQHFT